MGDTVSMRGGICRYLCHLGNSTLPKFIYFGLQSTAGCTTLQIRAIVTVDSDYSATPRLLNSTCSHELSLIGQRSLRPVRMDGNRASSCGYPLQTTSIISIWAVVYQICHHHTLVRRRVLLNIQNFKSHDLQCACGHGNHTGCVDYKVSHR